MKTVSETEKKLATDVAYLSYVKGWHQKTIADTLKISQNKVSRLKALAIKLNIIEFKVNQSHNHMLEKKLPNLVPSLKRAYITNDANIRNNDQKNAINLGNVGGEILGKLIVNHPKDEIVISISCGASLKQVIDSLIAFFESSPEYLKCLKSKTITLYPTAVQHGFLVSETSPSNLVNHFHAQLGKFFYSIKAYTPMIATELMANHLLGSANTQIGNYLLTDAPDICIFGLGLTDDANYVANVSRYFHNELLPEHSKNTLEINHSPIDNAGNPIPRYFSDVINIKIERLRELANDENHHIIAIGGSERKKDAIFNSLQNPCYDTLITDVTAAEYIINRLEKNNHQQASPAA